MSYWIKHYDITIFQGLSARQFHSLYKRSFPYALNPARLAASVFRLCDANRDGVVDFEEFLTSVCMPPSRSVKILGQITTYK